MISLLNQAPQVVVGNPPPRLLEESTPELRQYEIRRRLSLDANPFLDDHRIDGTAVLPGVMGVEAFAEAAAALVPGYRAAAIEDVDFLAPFKFYRDEPRVITVTAVFFLGLYVGKKNASSARFFLKRQTEITEVLRLLVEVADRSIHT